MFTHADNALLVFGFHHIRLLFEAPPSSCAEKQIDYNSIVSLGGYTF